MPEAPGRAAGTSEIPGGFTSCQCIVTVPGITRSYQDGPMATPTSERPLPRFPVPASLSQPPISTGYRPLLTTSGADAAALPFVVRPTGRLHPISSICIDDTANTVNWHCVRSSGQYCAYDRIRVRLLGSTTYAEINRQTKGLPVVCVCMHADESTLSVGEHLAEGIRKHSGLIDRSPLRCGSPCDTVHGTRRRSLDARRDDSRDGRFSFR